MQVCLIQEKATTGLIIQSLNQLDNVIVVGENVQCLDLLQFLHLLQILKLILHALNGHVLTCP